MPTTANATTRHGGCHCGKLRVAFTTRLVPALITPRACDCSFCRKHGAAYVSDPAGELSVTASDAALLKYRQGSSTCDFLLCRHCGVLVAVTFSHQSRLYGAVNSGCLDVPTGLGPSAPASPQSLAAGEKVARWLQLWVRDVRVDASGD